MSSDNAAERAIEWVFHPLESSAPALHIVLPDRAAVVLVQIGRPFEGRTHIFDGNRGPRV
jgi:hypothetical protein